MSKQKNLSEFEIIARYFSDVGLSSALPELVKLGIGDDCALLSLPDGYRLALSIDTLVAGTHFLVDANPFDIAQRALAVSISDLAAMGAKPIAFTLALTLPSVDEQWLNNFSEGLKAASDGYQIALVGGDTTRGPLSITIQVHGLLPNDQVLKRSGAQTGDWVFVSGSLGDAAVALDALENRLHADDHHYAFLQQRYYQPQARIELGQRLLGMATSAIDISDGLIADVGHIASSSNVNITINSDALPISEVTQQLLSKTEAIQYALAGGDDYELCFTAPPSKNDYLCDIAKECGVSITHIGTVDLIEPGQIPVVRCVDQNGRPVSVAKAGYQHFS